MECRMKGCTEEAVGHVVIRLPERWDEHTVIAEDQRDKRVGLCADHLEAVSSGVGDFSFKLGSTDAQGQDD